MYPHSLTMFTLRSVAKYNSLNLLFIAFHVSKLFPIGFLSQFKMLNYLCCCLPCEKVQQKIENETKTKTKTKTKNTKSFINISASLLGLCSFCFLFFIVSIVSVSVSISISALTSASALNFYFLDYLERRLNLLTFVRTFVYLPGYEKHVSVFSSFCCSCCCCYCSFPIVFPCSSCACLF